MRVRPPPPAPLVLVPKAYPADAIREQDEGRGAAYLPAFFRLFLVLFAIAPFDLPLKTNSNLERESKDSGVCKEAGNDEEAIHERTDCPQAEGSRS